MSNFNWTRKPGSGNPIVGDLILSSFLLMALQSLPQNCEITRVANDGAYASCSVDRLRDDGTRYTLHQEIYYDPDGQPWANNTGIPIREPGWIAITADLTHPR